MSAQVPYYGPFSNEPCQTVTEWVEIIHKGALAYVFWIDYKITSISCLSKVAERLAVKK